MPGNDPNPRNNVDPQSNDPSTPQWVYDPRTKKFQPSKGGGGGVPVSNKWFSWMGNGGKKGMDWGAIIQAAASLYSAYANKKKGKEDKKTTDKALELQERQMAETRPYAQGYMRQAQSALNPALSYYQSLMSGDRYQTQATLAPELNTIAQKYKGAYGAQRTLSPRGGATAAQGAAYPWQAAGEQSNLLMGSRADAARALSGLGTQLAGLGLNAYGLNANLSNGLLDWGFKQQQLSSQNQAAAGAAFFNALGSLGQAYSTNRNTTQSLPINNNSVGSIYRSGQGAPGVSGVPSNPYQYGGSKP